MTVTRDKLILLRSHACSSGIGDDALKEISDASELVEFAAGEYLHRPNQVMSSVFLVVHGRLKQAVVDLHGNVLLHRS